MRPGPFAPVVGLDIDGTSGDYHGHFTKFIEQWTGRPMPDPSQYTGGVPFHKHLGVSRSTYNDAKLAYRQGGLQHDAVLYGEHKWRDLARAVGVERVVCVYDDLPAMTGQAEGIGLTAWLRTQPYNTYSGTPKRVGSVVDMQVAFNLSYLKWKSNHADS
jgi:hypothetical protein